VVVVVLLDYWPTSIGHRQRGVDSNCMLPWEHAAVAYLLYSGYSRLRYGEPPNGWAVLVVLFASQLPDLIDKPLAWEFGLVPSGRSVAHSIFVGVPLSGIVLLLARQYGQPQLGVSFGIGYLSHLATDAVPLYPDSSTSFESILWPVRTYEEPSDPDDGFVEITFEILTQGLSLFTAAPRTNALVAVVLVGLMGIVWLIDGLPGLRETATILVWPFAKLRTAMAFK